MGTTPNHLKHPDKHIIKMIAVELMCLNQNTTVRAVTKYLKEMGYVAFNSLISEFMEYLAEEENWSFEVNNNTRVYSLLEPSFRQFFREVPAFSEN
ncbi:MAG: hypothetical protein AB8G15_03300 [Saprospiraceae bacterium]